MVTVRTSNAPPSTVPASPRIVPNDWLTRVGSSAMNSWIRCEAWYWRAMCPSQSLRLSSRVM